MTPNLQLVSGNLLLSRGGQPETTDDWFELASLGVRQVIKLNTDEEAADFVPPGVELFKCPITTTEQVLTEPDEQSLVDAVGFIVGGTFVHCEHGQDRTGLVIAMHRVQNCGWQKQDAEAEMLEHGFHTLLFGLWRFWQDWRPS